MGRAAQVVLRDLPNALHVALIGSFERRIRQASAQETDPTDDVRRAAEDVDRTRAAYLHHFYKADPSDPGLYHLLIDSTVLGFDTCAELIVVAARARSGDTTSASG